MMEPRFAEKAAFTVIGYEITATYDESHRIPELWSRLVPQLGEIKFIDTWGVTWPREADFDHLVGCEVTDASDLRDGMVTRDVPGGRYAVFTHHGKLTTIGDTYAYAEQTWFPQSGRQRDITAPFLELYDDRFKGADNEESIMEIWLPIK